MVKAVNIATDTQVTQRTSTLYGVIFTGAAAGNKVEISDSASGAGTAIVTVVASGAYSTVFTPAVGIHFSSGLYADITTSGTVVCTLLYD